MLINLIAFAIVLLFVYSNSTNVFYAYTLSTKIFLFAAILLSIIVHIVQKMTRKKSTSLNQYYVWSYFGSLVLLFSFLADVKNVTFLVILAAFVMISYLLGLIKEIGPNDSLYNEKAG